MKRTKTLLNLALMLALSTAVFAGNPQLKEPDCMIPPCPQDRDCDEEMMFDFDMFKQNHQKFEQHEKHDKKNFMKGENFKGNLFEKKFKDLNLTDKQKEDIKALKKTTGQVKEKLAKEYREKSKLLNDEYLKENIVQKK